MKPGWIKPQITTKRLRYGNGHPLKSDSKHSTHLNSHFTALGTLFSEGEYLMNQRGLVRCGATGVAQCSKVHHPGGGGGGHLMWRARTRHGYLAVWPDQAAID